MPDPIGNGNARVLPLAIALAEDQMVGPDVDGLLKNGVSPASDLLDVEHVNFLLRRGITASGRQRDRPSPRSECS